MARRRNKEASSAEPWYGEGLHFECRPDCGACCVNHGTSTYVYLEGDDDEKLARHLGLELAAFHARYTFEEEGYRALAMDDPDCVFLERNRCGVYDARPTQCRTFPFWPENVRSVESWRALSDFCPGIDEGGLRDHATIARNLRIMDAND